MSKMQFLLLISVTEHLMLYIILVVPLLVCQKNQVRCTSVARAYLGLFSFFFSSRRTGRPCLLACLLRYSRERAYLILINFSSLQLFNFDRALASASPFPRNQAASSGFSSTSVFCFSFARIASLHEFSRTRSSETRRQLNVFALVADAGDYKLGTTDQKPQKDEISEA